MNKHNKMISYMVKSVVFAMLLASVILPTQTVFASKAIHEKSYAKTETVTEAESMVVTEEIGTGENQNAAGTYDVNNFIADYGMSLFSFYLFICFTVWFISLGMGK